MRQIINARLGYYTGKLSLAKSHCYPFRLEIITTHLCNLRCKFCQAHNYPDTRENSMSLDNFKKLGVLLKHVRVASFCSGGEHFINRSFPEMLEFATRYQTLINITTNGMLLTRELSRFVVNRTNLFKLNFSCDGATKSTVELLRHGADFEKIKSGMALFNEERQKSDRKQKPHMVIRCAIMKANVEEMPGVINLAREVGADEVIFSHAAFGNNLDKDFMDYKTQSLAFYDPKKLKELFKETRVQAERYRIGVQIPALHNTDRAWKCLAPWQMFKVLPDGASGFCLKSWPSAIPGFNYFSDVRNEQDFFALWNSPFYQRLRKTIHTREPYYCYCQVCHKVNNQEQQMFLLTGEEQKRFQVFLENE